MSLFTSSRRRGAGVRGFTLIELVIVVAIVGLLSSAALPLARWSLKRSREYELQQNLRILRNAIDRYHDAASAGLIEVPEGGNGFPPSLAVLVEGVPLVRQMPPVAPAVSDEYAATGPGLTGGLGAQLAETAGQSAAGATAGGVTPSGSGARARQAPGAPARSPLFGGRTASAAGSQGVSRLGPLQISGDAGRRQGLGQRGADNDAEPEVLLGADGQPLRLIFLRRVPLDPMTGDDDWGLRCYGEAPEDRLWCGRDVFDVYSKSFERSIDGTSYRDW